MFVVILSQLSQQIKGGGKMKVRRRGQSVLEYVIIISVVIGVILLVAAAVIRTNVSNAINKSGDALNSAASNLPKGI